MSNWKTYTGGSGDFFKFKNIGDSIEGTFVEFRKSGFTLPNLVLTVNGQEKVCSISSGVIACFEEVFDSTDKVPEGVRVRLRFVRLGTAKPGQQPYKGFELDVDETTLPEGFVLPGAEATPEQEDIPY